MPRNTETTTKFRVDISELKQSLRDANRAIALTNSEFKAATAGMENGAIVLMVYLRKSRS